MSLPGVGQLRLPEITVPSVDRLLTAVRKAHGPGVAKAARTVLSGDLGEAVRRGVLPANPVRDTSSRRAHRRPGSHHQVIAPPQAWQRRPAADHARGRQRLATRDSHEDALVRVHGA